MRALGALSEARVAEGDEASYAAAAWSCTGCRGCRELCLLDNPVADTVWDARRDAWNAGLTPEPVRALRQGFDARLSRLRDRLPDGLASVPAGDGDAVFVPGCTMLAKEPDLAARGASAIAKIRGGVRVLTDVCCGAPLRDAGDHEGFVANARRFVEAVGDAREVILGDAGCAYALRRGFTAAGLFPSRWARAEHVSEFAARHLDRVGRVDDSRAVVIHDACRLGRGLGVYDAPRAVLHALRGDAPRELPEHHAHGRCSGGGGLLPVSRPAGAAVVAEDLAALVREVVDPAAAVVVTSCPTSRAQLRSRGVASEDLLEWLARAQGV
jgi:Fe-S oxidoreductase